MYTSKRDPKSYIKIIAIDTDNTLTKRGNFDELISDFDLHLTNIGNHNERVPKGCIWYYINQINDDLVHINPIYYHKTSIGIVYAPKEKLIQKYGKKIFCKSIQKDCVYSLYKEANKTYN